MPLECRKIALLAAVGCLVACSHPGEKAAETVAAEQQWSCFNGCAIFLQEGRYGLLRERDGEVLLPACYDTIEFLDNDIALLTGEGVGSLCDRSGRMLAQGCAPDSLRQNYATLVERVREEDRRSWEQVISDYDRLCLRAKAQRGRRTSRRDMVRLKETAKQVEADLQAVSGKPTPSQKARLEAISNDYRRAFQ